jgi:hypothetical protein
VEHARSFGDEALLLQTFHQELEERLFGGDVHIQEDAFRPNELGKLDHVDLSRVWCGRTLRQSVRAYRAGIWSVKPEARAESVAMQEAVHRMEGIVPR